MKKSQNLPLSSACTANERENVLNHMGYDNGFFAFSRTVDGSIPNRFYPTLEEAYKTTLSNFSEMGPFKYNKNNYFSISDNAKNIIYKGEVMPSRKIKFSVYGGTETYKVSTITEELNKLSTISNLNNKIMNPKSTPTVNVETLTKSETNEMAPTLSHNAQVYLDNDILTQSNLNFLCLPEEQAKSLAQLIQETATNNKEADNQTFTKAIADVSNGMVVITKTLASGKPIVSSHVSFHDDTLYCAAHCKSSEALLDGSNTWRKVPGKIAYGKIREAVMDMYHKGQQLLLNSPTGTHSKITEQSAISNEKLSLSEVSANITSTVMTYLRCTPDMLHYFTIKGNTLEADLELLSNGVIVGGLLNNNITLSIPSGHSCEISPSRFTSDEQLRNAISMKVAQLLVGASISDITRDKVSSLVNLSTIEEYYISSTKQLESQAA